MSQPTTQAPKFTLRPATEDDLPKMLEIERQSYPHPWTEGNFRAEFEKPYSQVLVLTDDETDTEVAGYIVFWLLAGEGHILNVAVSMSHRGLGHGKHMIRAAINSALKADVKRILLEVRKSNLRAVQLYQGLHFTITGLQKSFYSDGEDAYQMTLSLHSPDHEF